jgi:hypothetical protein
MAKNNEKLKTWQETVKKDESEYASEITAMTTREKIFRGQTSIDTILDGDTVSETTHVRNIVAELIESEVSSAIPQPKVTALHKEDEHLAKLIEDMLRNRLNLLPMEEINDLQERVVPVNGGGFLQVEWNNKAATHTTIGESVVSFRHPITVIPQQGVTSSVEDMDHITIKIPQTTDYIRRRYNVDVSAEGEEDPSIRSAEGSAKSVTGMVTQYMVYYRNDDGGIGVFSYVRDTVLEDLEDYQARHLRRCRNCGADEPPVDVDMLQPTTDGTYPDDAELIRSAVSGRSRCPYCGGTYMDTTENYITVQQQIDMPEGAAVQPKIGDVIPFYKPDLYPLCLQRNVSAYGQLLGSSDVELIRYQQNTINRLYAKELAMMLNAGSYIILPHETKIKHDSVEGKEIRVVNPADANMIRTINMTPDVSQIDAKIEQTYQEARQLIGITDSFQGRKDTTATSGKAKEFAASQTAGRLESKRVMKNAMWARLFELLFKFELAYADEIRPVVGKDAHGNNTEEEWSKWLFLKQDSAGAYYWATDFLFECDSTAPLAQNREAMWEEMRSHYQAGAFGDPTQLDTMILYWEQMKTLHYPNAGRICDQLKEKQQKAAKQQLDTAQAQKQAMQQAQTDVSGMPTQIAQGAQEGPQVVAGEPTQSVVPPEVNAGNQSLMQGGDGA